MDLQGNYAVNCSQSIFFEINDDFQREVQRVYKISNTLRVLLLREPQVIIHGLVAKLWRFEKKKKTIINVNKNTRKMMIKVFREIYIHIIFSLL